uniref:Uncharacterized protein n=1 Tax=Virgibacillus oceani TaxID=1479511 RepID=A0A917H1H1_9BACI|nr:hypothetical protein GCM10011398_04080 [Virgibacillus oceani]
MKIYVFGYTMYQYSRKIYLFWVKYITQYIGKIEPNIETFLLFNFTKTCQSNEGCTRNEQNTN